MALRYMSVYLLISPSDVGSRFACSFTHFRAARYSDVGCARVRARAIIFLGAGSYRTGCQRNVAPATTITSRGTTSGKVLLICMLASVVYGLDSRRSNHSMSSFIVVGRDTFVCETSARP